MSTKARKYLTEQEVAALMAAAKRRARNAKNGHRDATMIRAAYVHGLRVSELVGLRWSQVDLKTGTLTVGRMKNGKPAAHPVPGDESRALRQIERDWPDNGGYVFVSERGGPMSDEAFRKMLGLAADEAGISRELVHPHALRHACGHKMANDGVTTRVIQDYLGHKNIAHTVVYTELVASKFEGIWNKRG